MNLIEQLGGYEKAKTVVDKAPCKTYTYHNHPYQKGYIRCWGGDGKEYFLVSDIEQALLEYRRQHNIFEVGDLVVLINKPGLSSSLHRVLAVNAPTTIHVCPINQVSGSDLVVLGFMASPYYLRHATDAEFVAGKRLGVD